MRISRAPVAAARLVSIVFLLGAGCCGGGDVAAGVDAGVSDGGTDGPACSGTPLEVVESFPGSVDRLYAHLPFEGTDQPFLVDTGSPVSFFRAEQGGDTDGGVRTTISCVEGVLPGFAGNVMETTPSGVPVRGLLGCDLISRGATIDLQLANRTFFWWHSPPADWPTVVTLPATLHTPDFALLVSSIELDGKPVRLVLDTGSPNILIIDPKPRPNETEQHAVDGTGASVTLYTSTIEVSFGGKAKRAVAVDRAEHFPAVESLIAELGGGDVVGLLGLGALGDQRIAISSTNLRFTP